MNYRELDLGELEVVSIAERASKVDESTLATPPESSCHFGCDYPPMFADFWRSLPKVLAVKELQRVVEAVRTATQRKRAVVLMIGGHVIKCGIGPLISKLCAEGYVTHVAMNGAAAIHDFELALFSKTSEDVQAGLDDGSFGMVEETSKEFNGATDEAADHNWGLGEGLMTWLENRRVTEPGSIGAYHASVIAACCEYEVPLTVHPIIGAEIVHQHPAAHGSAIGKASMKDFRRLAGALPDLDDGGVVLNWGSAVVMPEVFLKALTIARNITGKPKGFLSADFDMQRQYRSTQNVVRRPTEGHGVGVQLTGHHELLLPLFVWGLLTGEGSYE